MNKKFVLSLLLTALSLASCVDTEQLYNREDYLSGSFVEHCYNVWEGSTKAGHDAIAYSKYLAQLPYDYLEAGYYLASLTKSAKIVSENPVSGYAGNWFNLSLSQGEEIKVLNHQGGEKADLYYGFSDLLHVSDDAYDRFEGRSDGHGGTSISCKVEGNYDLYFSRNNKITVFVHNPERPATEHQYIHVPEGYFSGSGNTGQENLASCNGYGQAKRYHPDYFKLSDGTELAWGGGDPSDIVPGEYGAWADNSPLYNRVYSQNKRLDRFYEGFSRGFVSKFYNGQIKCDGWSYYAMAVLSPEGYGTMFPHELVSSEYFAMAVLMGTDYFDHAPARVAVADIDVTFYKYSNDGRSLVGYQVLLDDVNLSCNNSSSKTSLVGFTFADVGIDPKGIVGMSMNWGLVEDPTGAGDDFGAEGYHDGICLYEVLFPDSTWN